MSEDLQKSTYHIPHASTMEEEVRRLDATHIGFKEYFNGKLTLAPLEESSPQRILELGSGAGLWAIQAAQQFPNARVIGIDLKPIPSWRVMPPNMEFMALDMNKPLPFEENIFDIIHARLTLMHLPDPTDFLHRVIPLLRTGGWLVLEEIDMIFFDNSKLGIGPATVRIANGIHAAMMDRHVQAGHAAYDGMLRAKGVFSEVNTRVIPVYMSAQSGDPKLNKLGANVAENFIRVGENLAVKGAFGLTNEDVKMCKEELDNPERDTRSNFICTWAQRHREVELESRSIGNGA